MKPRSLRAALILFAGCALAAVGAVGAVGAGAPPDWPDTPLARLEALALIETLNDEILSSPSATLTLERWCREHALAEQPVILAHRTEAAGDVPSAQPRQDLQVSARESVRYRRVELTCGEHVLSVAENWYVPDRLTASGRSGRDLLSAMSSRMGKDTSSNLRVLSSPRSTSR